MACLVDTSILVRLANKADSKHTAAAKAVLMLHEKSESLHITPQNLVEFRAVATRPVSVNGLGLSLSATEALSNVFETSFDVLPESPQIFTAWKDIVSTLGVVGKQVHDARLIAVCHVHSLTHVMTFNVSHFTRLAGYGLGVTVVSPETM